MCTLTYIPLANDAFTITQNRDESIKRTIASPPIKRIIGGVQHVYSVDIQGMGTWIGFSETGRVASLLNGGTKEHMAKPPYKHSRGLIIPDYFAYPSFLEFINNYDFRGLEPFTLLVFESGNIYETILEEEQVRYTKINPEMPFIYSSAALYPQETRSKRNEALLDWFLIDRNPDQQRILDFHKRYLFENEPHRFNLAADQILKTVSITSIVSEGNKMKVDYYDLIHDIHFWNALSLRMVA